eukprot:RCo013351
MDPSPRNSFRRRTAVSASPLNSSAVESFQSRNIPKNEDELRRLNAILFQNCLFAHLEESERTTVIQAMELHVFKEGENILQQGGKGKSFCIVGRGQVGVVINEKRVSKIREGGTFGELELMYDSPCAATIVAESPEVDIWEIDSETYRLLIMRESISKRKEYSQLLNTIPLFRELSGYDRDTLADALRPEVHPDGSKILSYGEEEEWMYIIREGRVAMIGRSLESGEHIKICEFREGHHFGELEFVNTHPYITDAVCIGPTKVVKLNRYHIELCMSSIRQMLFANFNNPVFSYYREKMLARSLKYIGRAGRRRAPTVSSESYEVPSPAFVPALFPKDPATAERLQQILARNVLFCRLEADELQLSVNVLTKRAQAVGEVISRQGEYEALFFIVESGVCSRQVDDRPPQRLEAGETFGEMELACHMPCQATIKAESSVVLWTIDRLTYRHIFWKLLERDKKQAKLLGQQLPVLQQYTIYQLLSVYGLLEKPVRHCPGELVVQAGQPADYIYFVLEGALEVSSGSGASLGGVAAGEYPLVGDQEVLHCLPVFHVSAVASSGTGGAITARLPASFDSVVATLSPVLERLLENPHAEPLRGFYSRLISQPPAQSILQRRRLAVSAHPDPAGGGHV